ncbi:DNA integrity scanning protein DisA nucleotide-binding domain protein [Calycomorphotria hydatis]|uniref:DNA integrity scanning protein DisA n=1 Tax=Calycomorphotria hydatis TaxID=2528027 RepID=A0A517T9R8_9PLAN|nr:diadenylate cyclase [Calycomorphotria hydatis]QDT65113.1 DNA integrity scanning protein DisA [Calycomorphotria hydatis]
MKRVAPSESMQSLIDSAVRLAASHNAQAVILLADVPYSFREIREQLLEHRLVVASEKPNVQEAAKEDGIDLVPIQHEPQTRQLQLSQALLEGIADELLAPREPVVAIYSLFDRDKLDTVSVVSLAEQLSKLTARDLRRLETTVPLETLRIVVDIAVEIGREGREGKSVGTLFVVGDHRKVMKMSHEQVHDPFRGYGARDRMIRSPRVQESIKEIAQLDGAFIVSSGGQVQAAGRHIDAPATGLTLSKGLGSRHWSAAAISKQSKAIAIAVSESTGTVRIFQDGYVVLRIEPMDRGMKWSAVEVEPPSGDD